MTTPTSGNDLYTRILQWFRAHSPAPSSEATTERVRKFASWLVVDDFNSQPIAIQTSMVMKGFPAVNQQQAEIVFWRYWLQQMAEAFLVASTKTFTQDMTVLEQEQCAGIVTQDLVDLLIEFSELCKKDQLFGN